MHAVSLLGFFHRSGGRLVGLPPDIRYASRLEQNVEKMWMSLQPYLSFSQCQQLYGLERDIKHSGTLCSCRAKTALVTNVELTPQQLSSIDQSGFGAHCLQGVTKNLGLPIHGT